MRNRALSLIALGLMISMHLACGNKRGSPPPDDSAIQTATARFWQETSRVYKNNGALVKLDPGTRTMEGALLLNGLAYALTNQEQVDLADRAEADLCRIHFSAEILRVHELPETSDGRIPRRLEIKMNRAVTFLKAPGGDPIAELCEREVELLKARQEWIVDHVSPERLVFNVFHPSENSASIRSTIADARILRLRFEADAPANVEMVESESDRASRATLDDMLEFRVMQ